MLVNSTVLHLGLLICSHGVPLLTILLMFNEGDMTRLTYFPHIQQIEFFFTGETMCVGARA